MVTRRLLRKLVAAASLALVILVALELTVRIWGYSERHIYDPIYTSYERTAEIPSVHKPNLVQARYRRVLSLTGLLVLTKIANAFGFFWERGRRTRDHERGEFSEDIHDRDHAG
jgi:hypothetical protein